MTVSTDSKTTVRTPKFRASYAHKLFKASPNDQGVMKYSMSMIFDESQVDLSEMRKAAEAAAIEEWGKDRTKWPRNLRMPFRDGDEDRPDDPAYAGATFVGTSVNNQPEVVKIVSGEDGRRRFVAIGEEEFYSGCYAIASGRFKAYKVKGNIGIGFYVNNVVKVAEGERIGGSAPAKVAFADMLDDDDFELGEESAEDMFN